MILDETNDVYIQYSDIIFRNDEMLVESIHEEHLGKPALILVEQTV
jgi:hypothetical protein